MTIDAIKIPQPGDKCLVCSGDPEIIGVFMPENSTAWGAKEGKTRLIRYCLCQKCHGQTETPERVEKIIRSEMTGGVSHAE